MFHISLIFNIKCCDFKGKKKSQDYGGPSLCQVFAAFLGGNIHQSVFSMGRCNWHYQPRSVDEAIGLWGSAICWSMFSNKGGRGRRTPKATTSEVCLPLFHNPAIRSVIQWPGLWLMICSHGQAFCHCPLCTCLAPLPSFKPDLSGRLCSLCVQWAASLTPKLHPRLYSSRIGGGWILWKCDSIHLSSRQLDSL